MAAVPCPRPSPTRLADRFAVVDVETNGLSDRRHRLLQIAVVTVDGDGTVLDRWASFVRPRFGRVGPTHIHGLTAAELRVAPTFAHVAPALLERLDGAVFTAHNADFDWGFVSQSLRRAGYQAPDTARLCTMRLSRSLAAEPTSHRLVDVCARHGVTITRAHDALADAEATATVLPLLLADGNVSTTGALAAHLAGGDRGPWPAWTPPPWWRRALYG